MDTQSIVTYKSAFDAIMHEIMADDGSQMEVWYAREDRKSTRLNSSHAK